MRYFLAFFALTCVLVVLVAGRRGDLSRRPPIEIWNDMDRQLKLRPQASSGFSGWEDGLSSRQPVEGTVSRTRAVSVGGREVLPFEDNPAMTGREAGKTNFVEFGPLPVTMQLMARGRERYTIHCTPCHGAAGDGNGVVKKYGHGAIPTLLDQAKIQMTDGYLYHVIRMGSPSGLMGPYGAQIEPEDRWAIVAYLRALQLARLGTAADVPPDVLATLK
ncbi:MAG: c-type cytochrome [Limisphaerales bacterium]